MRNKSLRLVVLSIFILSLPVVLWAAIALIGSGVTAAGDADTVTTGTYDTTGANFIVVGVSHYYGITADCTLSDSKSNSWTPLTSHTSGTTNFLKSKLYYSVSPTVGSGHTFTCAGSTTFPSISVLAFSDVATSNTLDVENGNGTDTTVTEITTGSITPNENSELIIAHFVSSSEDSFSVDSGMTLQLQTPHDANSQSSALAWKVQSTAAAINVKFTWSNGSNGAAASIASFKENAGGGGASTNRMTLLGVR